MMEKITVEEGLRLTFKDWKQRGNVADAMDGQLVTLTLTQNFEVPAAYAKAILREILLEEINAKNNQPDN
jgi:hypothetical protein